MTTITDIQNPHPASVPTRKRNQGKQPDTAAEASPSISSTSTLLAEMESRAHSAPDIDEAKVEAVRQAIQSGELSIDYDKLAQKMLNFELTLFDD